MQNNESMSSGQNFGHRQTQSFAVKPSTSPENGFSNGPLGHSSQQSISGYGDRHPQRSIHIPNINTNTNRMSMNMNNQQSNNYNELQTPQTGYDMNFTPLLPSQLLMGSPFQPGSPSTFQSPQFQSFSSFTQQPNHHQNNRMSVSMNPMYQQQSAPFSPGMLSSIGSPNPIGSPYFGGMQSPTTGFNGLGVQNMAPPYGQQMQMGNLALVSGTSRTVYLGNIPPETTPEEILSHVRSGQIESVRLLPDKNCAFISFLDASSATHFHSDAILKKLSIQGQDIKIGWGKPSSVPTSVALAVQQSGASRNVYLGNLSEETTEDELREDLSKFGPIDTVKLVREKSIGFVHYLSIGNAIKAVTQLPQDPKYQAPRRVYYGKDRCAYVSKTQQQNAAQYLGIAPGYAHVLNGADRDLITNALAQQSVAAAAVATTAGGVSNLGNRTVYLGNIHPETTIEEICNVVRGGLLHHIRYIPDKHICFVTFIDPTSAASFYALSNLQGLMIHNRRLKIGWGKHSGALPPAIALAVSGGASRNVYVGNLDESWTEDRLRQDFSEYGDIELVNTLREKSCAFVNFTNIANAIKAIEAVRGKEEYKRFKVNFGKDRCGNPPRQASHQQQQQQYQQQSDPTNGLSSPSPVNGLAPGSRAANSISPVSSNPPHHPSSSGYDPRHGPTASTIFNTGTNNPLTMYLAATQHAAAQAAADQQQALQNQRRELSSPDSTGSGYPPPSTSPFGNVSAAQQAFYSSPNEVTGGRSSAQGGGGGGGGGGARNSSKILQAPSALLHIATSTYSSPPRLRRYSLTSSTALLSQSRNTPLIGKPSLQTNNPTSSIHGTRPHVKEQKPFSPSCTTPFIHSSSSSSHGTRIPSSTMSSPPAFGHAVSLNNRCGESKSPYVRSHMDNPTAWQLWSPETLELARKTNRLLFVSIGYSACHWCHVMEHESFSDSRIAQLLNEHFIPIKIDREERPDIDRQYMDFLQATSGGGGWPLNVFVTPDLEPIFGGTYWPGPNSERAKTGAAGTTFGDVLRKVSTAWKEQEQKCRANAKDITRQLREYAQEGMLGGRDGKQTDENDGLELDLLDDAYEHYKGRYDAKCGGFGGAPKFPTPVHIKPLLRVASYPHVVREIVGEEECQEARRMAVHTLESMAKGGIKDQVGHGFARYSVTRDWSLPHFEKMLYDNAQLLPVYLDAWILTKSPLLLDTVNDIATYLTSPPMVSELGGIFSAEDADSLPTPQDKHKREGAYYVWTMDEFKSILSEEEATVCAKYWGVKAQGNVDRRFDLQGELVGQNTLCIQYEIPDLAAELQKSEQQISQVIQSGRAKLLAYREKNRPRPALDDKIVTSWNGLAIGGLARTSSALRHISPEPAAAYLSAALKATNCIKTHLFDPSTRTLKRVYREGPGETPGFADDYAFLISGLLDLYEATWDSSWLEFADTLQQTQTRLFWDEEKYGFFSTAAEQPDILIRVKDAMDNAEPSVNGVAAHNLFRLASLLHDAEYEKMARRIVACFEVELGQHPGLFSGMLSSVVSAKMGVKGLVVVGQGALVDEVLKRMRETVWPMSTALRVGGEGVEDGWLRERNGLVKDLDGRKEMVQICEGGRCRILDMGDVEGLFGGD